jgi:hypothetical protein
MSELENRTRKTMGCLINDLSFRLDGEQQRCVALWAIKTAMVIEGAKNDKNTFYSTEVRQLFRQMLIPPPDTAVWLGRCAQSYLLHGEARELHVKQPAGANPLLSGRATTFVMARLVVQILSLKRKPEVIDPENLRLHIREGPWKTKLIQAWPIEKDLLNWPPPASFSDDDGLSDLRRRFAVGISREGGNSQT